MNKWFLLIVPVIALCAALSLASFSPITTSAVAADHVATEVAPCSAHAGCDKAVKPCDQKMQVSPCGKQMKDGCCQKGEMQHDAKCNHDCPCEKRAKCADCDKKADCEGCCHKRKADCEGCCHKSKAGQNCDKPCKKSPCAVNPAGDAADEKALEELFEKDQK